MTVSARIPADVDRRDKLVGPFTARQLAILAVTALGVYLAWMLTRELMSPPVFVACTVPLGALVTGLVLTTRDGLSGDQLLVAAIGHRLRPHRLAAAPDGLSAAPRWLTARASRKPKSAAQQPITNGTAHLPQQVDRSGDVGVVDLGPDGLVAVAVAGTVNLALRTPAEQAALVAQLGGWLHTLRQPVQILIRSTRLDLTGRIAALRTAAQDMSPELAEAAHDHAAFLTDLATSEDLLHRQVLLVWREPLHRQVLLVWREPLHGASAATLGLAGPSARTLAASLLPSRRRAAREVSAAARRAAETRLLRRLSEATDMLAPLGVTVTALDDAQATAIVASATNPASLVPHSADIAAPDAVITTAASELGEHTSTDSDDDGPTMPRRESRRIRLRRPRFGTRSVFAPQSLTVGARAVEVGSDWVSTLAVTGYPREVAGGWLAPLLAHPGRVDLSLHIDPIDPVTAANRLRRQQARLESSRGHNAAYGLLPDPQLDVAAEDAADLSARVARGEGRLFRVGLYLSVHASTETELAEEVSAVRALAASLLIDTCHLTYRAVPAWTATLPLGLDPVRVARTFDTDALAAAFPFTSPQLPVGDPVSAHRPEGVLYGRDAASGLVFWDRFAETIHNHNMVVLGRSGSGKSYLVKSEVLRSLQRGIEVIVIDPEDEYRPLAEAVCGTYLRLGAPEVRLNPFDLEVHTRPDGRRSAPADALTRRKLFLHTVIRVLLGEQTPAQRAVLDTALTATYLAAEITENPATWTRPAPTLGMLAEQLQASGSSIGVELAQALAPFVTGGAFAGLIDGETTTRPEGAFVVFSLRELPDELKTLGTLLALDVTWRRVSNPAIRQPRLVVVDEAWWMLRQEAGGEFLFRAAKSFRKHWAGLTVATQDCADVLATELGKAIVANAATQVLLRQAPQAIDEVAAAFGLSDGERGFLLAADRGQGLLAVGTDRAVFASLASDFEDSLITTSPQFATAGEDTDLGVDLPGEDVPAVPVDLTPTLNTSASTDDDGGDEVFLDLSEAA
ncbi:PrgI family protein [Nocardia otitidiscaviarum]|uniref:PrgI family protein n=1 Tax=Nocardia otitidiscaviarum TaxID=1823 RepID=UPI001894DF9B|nr:PrgI family protein [Nocardia otitidiscaviarum]MBF6183365.1 PrgI family protein [Nocardia otitidiscaviarum]